MEGQQDAPGDGQAAVAGGGDFRPAAYDALKRPIVLENAQRVSIF
jgi:hypothetical protein